MRCPFCHNPEMVLPEHIAMMKEHFIPSEAVLRFLETRKGKLDGVSICGGEPTLQADLYDFIKEIKSLGFSVKIDTNGRDAKIIKQLVADQLLDYVAIDYKQALMKTPTAYNHIAGTQLPQNFYDNFLELLDFLRESDTIPYEYRTTVIKGIHTAQNIEQIAQHLQGIPNYYLQNYRPWNTLNPDFKGQWWSKEELEDFARIAQKYIPHVQVRM